jgi:hypothetical protein
MSCASRVRRSNRRAFSSGSLEGAMLVARSYGDAARFTAAAQRLLSELSGSRRKDVGRSTRAQAGRAGLLASKGT